MNQFFAAKRNNNIDILKFICAIFVMIIHVKVPYDPYYEPIVRSGVPCFFIISGYFLYTENGFAEKLKRAIRNTFNVFLWSTLVFLLYSLFLALASGNFSTFYFTPPKNNWYYISEWSYCGVPSLVSTGISICTSYFLFSNCS